MIGDKERLKAKNNVREKSFVKEVFDWFFCILIAFVAAVLIKYFIFTPTLVKQSSMDTTISPGERVLINRLVRTFKMPIFRGDIITFEAPNMDTVDGKAMYAEMPGVINFIKHDMLEIGKMSYIKRVIGVAGDHVKITSDKKVYVNDMLLNEPYLPKGKKTPIKGAYCDIIVPEGYIFVMGDNRDKSTDSREFGCIPLEKVEGRVLYRLLPFSRFGKIDK